MGIESRIDVTQRLERPDHQAGADQQHHGKRDLHHHQHRRACDAARASETRFVLRRAGVAMRGPAYLRTGIIPNRTPLDERGEEGEG